VFTPPGTAKLSPQTGKKKSVQFPPKSRAFSLTALDSRCRIFRPGSCGRSCVC